MQFTTQARVSLFLAHLLQTSYKCNVHLHKYTAHNFSRLLWCFILGLPGKGLKRGFLISNVSAGNTTLCHKQHVAHRLWVEQAWPRT